MTPTPEYATGFPRQAFIRLPEPGGGAADGLQCGTLARPAIRAAVSMMRIFLTGGTGYLGSAVLDALLRAGHEVQALVRQPERAEALRSRGVAPVLGDLGSPDTWRAALDGVDGVIHTALESSVRGATLDGQFVETAMAQLRRSPRKRVFIYTSGLWVLGPAPEPVDESAMRAPAPISDWRAAHEDAVLAANGRRLRTVVVRPGIVYGGGRGIVSDLLKQAMNGLMRVVGDGSNHWSCIYDRDLADLYVRLLGATGASGIYHATDGDDERVLDIVEAIARHLPSRPDLRHVPLEEARKSMGVYADALALDQRVQSPRARALGWAPSLPRLSGSIARLFEEYRAAHGR